MKQREQGRLLDWEIIEYGQCVIDKWLLVAGQEQLTNKHLSIANAETPNCEVQIACHPDFTIYEMVKWL